MNLRRLNKHVVTVATIAAIIIGFLIAVQIQAKEEADTAAQIQSKRLAQIKSVTESLKERNKQLQDIQDQLNEQIKNYTDESINNPFLINKLNELKMSDGTIDVQGPGVRLRIQDSGQNIDVLFPLNTDDLRRIVNTLRYAGAEAISVNGQRIVSSTSIVMSGDSTILVNSVPISKVGGTTYEILAIGDQNLLVDYLTNLEILSLKQVGMKVDLTREIVTVPAYKGGYNFEYAEAI
ncbi:MAG: DUF881 domain-containing protein [Peptococcaceae bacterium]|jgi:uncharacterized protein YlxW (UPF0749 family)|nr:DUF881 domain-containing protein [Peptococcaceae bacterium]